MHVWGLPPGGKRVGGSSTRAVPRTPLLFHPLKLMSCVCTLLPLSLFCLLSPDQAHPALPGNSKVLQSWSCLAHTCPQPECLPNHKERRSTSTDGHSLDLCLTSRRFISQCGERYHSARVWCDLPILIPLPPPANHLCPPSH